MKHLCKNVILLAINLFLILLIYSFEWSNSEFERIYNARDHYSCALGQVFDDGQVYMANDTSATLALFFSHKRGYYNAPFSLVLTTNDPKATIRYTTDQSKPSTRSGTIYKEPINITGTTYLRVLAYNDTARTEVFTHSYLFVADIINSSKMYKYITEDPTYGPLMEKSLKSLPVVSLVSSTIKSTGVISQEVETSVEMFWPDDSEKGFMLHSGIQTWGGSPSNPKKHYRLAFKEDYGTSKLKYDLFKPDNYDNTKYKTPPVKEFDKLILRSGSQDGLNAEFGNEKLVQYVRNRLMYDLQIEMGQIAAHGRFVHLFINGEYTGQYHLLERPDESFFESYLGGKKEDYEIRKNGAFLNGTGTVYNSLAGKINFSNAAAIENTNKYIDLENVASYLLLMSYASGFDWASNHNNVCGGHILAESGYKFILWDVDFSLGNGGVWHPSRAGNVAYFEAPIYNLGPVPLNLMKSLEFKYMLADQMECTCYNGGLLTPEYIDRAYMHRVDQINTSLIAESARWGGYNFNFLAGHIAANAWDVNDEFTKELNRLRTAYIPFRTQKMIDYYKSKGIASTLSAVQFNKYGGQVASEYSLVLSSEHADSKIYYTLDGSDPREVGGAISSTAILYSSAIALPDGKITVRARVKANTDANNALNTWSAMCPRTFYVGQEYSGLVINEIHYNPKDSIFFNTVKNAEDTIAGKNFAFIELKNKSDQAIDLANVAFTKGVSLIMDNFLMPPGGFAVFAEDADWFEARYGFAPEGTFSGKLGSDGEKLLLEDPFGNIIDSVRYYSSDTWDKAPSNKGYSLELLNAFSDNNDPFNWFRSDNIGGTPGVENSRVCTDVAEPIVINELNYNSNNDLFDPGNWIELYNPNNKPVDISGWTLYDEGGSFIIPQGTIMKTFGYLVLVEDFTPFATAFPNVDTSLYMGTLPFGLSKSGERLSLFDSNKCLSDYVVYDDKKPWPEPPDGEGPSLSLLDFSLDNALPTSWEASNTINSFFPYGTPGVSNVCTPGQSCDDGDPCTANDLFDNDCNCAGVLERSDSDNDGVCDIADQCPGMDDGIIATPCDDGDPCTTGETYDASCNCTGGMIEDTDKDGICDPLDPCDNNLAGTSCDDGDPCTTGETYDVDCNCTGGVFTDTDKDSVCDAEDLCENLDDRLFLQICDDGNPATSFDHYNSDSCRCAGIINNGNVCVRIGDSYDDVEENTTDGVIDFNSGDIELINNDYDQMVGLRFANLDVPQGAIITSAYIQFAADETSTGEANLRIMGQAIDHAPPFTLTERDVSTRDTTTASVEWMPAPWTTIGAAGMAERTTDISAVIDEIVNRPGYKQGNAIGIIIRGTGRRTAESYEGSVIKAPKLCLTYERGLCVLGYPCDDGNPCTTGEAYDINCDCSGGIDTCGVKARILLEGYYDVDSGIMHTEFRAKNLLPLSQPFTTAPWNYTGVETANLIPTEAVDWILVMVRDANGKVLGQAAGFVNQLGDLIGVDGSSGIPVANAQGNYISIHHRSHLAVMSSAIYSGEMYDFTSVESKAQGIAQLKQIGAKYLLYAGDYDGSGILNSIDFNKWKVQGAKLNEYLRIDGDGNGIINNEDYNLWIRNRSKVGYPPLRY